MTLPFRWRWATPPSGLVSGSSPLDLQYPLHPEPKIAAIRVAVNVPAPGRRFAHVDARQLAQFRPEALAAPLGDLRLLAQLQSAGWVDLRCLTFPFVVFSSPKDGLLNGAERNELWRAFQLPVFEQLRDEEGNLMAAECEAHDGLHIVAGSLCGGWDRTHVPCACGSDAPRILATGALRRALAANSGR